MSGVVTSDVTTGIFNLFYPVFNFLSRLTFTTCLAQCQVVPTLVLGALDPYITSNAVRYYQSISTLLIDHLYEGHRHKAQLYCHSESSTRLHLHEWFRSNCCHL